MAMLRTIGAYIDASSIGTCWKETNLFAECTVSQILEGSHVNRGMSTHLMNVEVMMTLYNEAFFSDKSLCC